MTASAPAGSIVVGIDGSPESDQALDWAARQAALEHRPLTIVHASYLGTTSTALWMAQPGVDVTGLLDDVRVRGQALLDAAATRAADLAPNVTIHPELSPLDPRQTLLGLAERATTVVVGSRGRGPVASLLLGSVSVAVSKHAACPVVVVRHQEGEGTRGGVLVDVDGTEDSLPAIEFAYRTAAYRSMALTALHVFYDDTYLWHDDHVVTADEPGLDEERMLLAESVAGMREKFPDVHDTLVLARGRRDRQVIRRSRDMDLVVVTSRQRGLVNDYVYDTIAPTVVEHAACDVAVVPCGVPPTR